MNKEWPRERRHTDMKSKGGIGATRKTFLRQEVESRKVCSVTGRVEVSGQQTRGDRCLSQLLLLSYILQLTLFFLKERVWVVHLFVLPLKKKKTEPIFRWTPIHWWLKWLWNDSNLHPSLCQTDRREGRQGGDNEHISAPLCLKHSGLPWRNKQILTGLQ